MHLIASGAHIAAGRASAGGVIGYFFSLGLGLAAGIAIVVLPAAWAYRRWVLRER